MDPVSYMEPQELADAILAGESGTADQTETTSTKGLVVIDVRSAEEFGEGHIKGAVNMPSDCWSRRDFVDDVVKQYSSSSTIVFHCAQSRIRGPTCAKMFLEHLHGDSDGSVDSASNKPAV